MKIKLYTLEELERIYGKENVWSLSSGLIKIIGIGINEFKNNLGKIFEVSETTGYRSYRAFYNYKLEKFYQPYIKCILDEELE